MKVTSQGAVFAHRKNTDASSCCFPSIAVLPTGRWIAGCRVGPMKSSRTERVVVSHSDDEGKTWSPMRQPVPEVMSHRGRPGQWRAFNLTPLGGSRVLGTLSWEDYSDPFRPMFNEATEGIVDMRMFTTVSEDGGQTWSKPREVTFGPFDNVPNAITGPTVIMPDGRWAAQFEVNKHYDETTPWQHHSSLTFSSDEGRTWTEVADTHTDPAKRIFCWDQRVAVMKDGSVLALYWTFDRKDAVYLNIHAAASKDSGRTWSKVWDTGVPGQPARPVSLPDGRIVMVYVDRTKEPIIKARVSGDGGKTWPASTETTVFSSQLRNQIWDKKEMKDAWAEMSEYSLGLPDATLLPSGDVLTVFYSGPKADQTDVLFARISV